MHKLNILVAGKSGVGKSSLLNYIIGDNTLFQTGEGSPVTQDYFNKEVFKANGVEYHLFDTKGVEPDTTEEFSEELTHRIAEYRNNPDVFEHIHTLYYCFGASNKRIEPFEISFIKEMLEQLDVVIVLTKSDLITDQVKEELHQEFIKIFGSDIKVITVCSVSKKLRIGEVKQFGKEEFLKHAFMGLWNTFSKHVPQIDDLLFFLKEEYILSNSTELRKNWYNFFTPFIYKRQDEIFVNLNAYSFFNLNSFVTDQLNQTARINLNFLLLLFKSVKNLAWNEFELLHMVENILLHIDRTYDKIIDFYSDLSGISIDIKPLKSTKVKIRELFDIYIELWEESILPLNEIYIKKIEPIVKNPSWFGREEELLLNEIKNNYLSKISEINKVIESKIDEVEILYKTELLQFGDILLKKSFEDQKEEDHLNVIKSISELSMNQKIYYKKLKDLLHSKVIINSEIREKLDFLRQALDISYSNAGLIEDYARK